MQMFPRGQELKRIPAWNVEKARRNYMGTRRGSETDLQNVIMHKANSLVPSGNRAGLRALLRQRYVRYAWPSLMGFSNFD